MARPLREGQSLPRSRLPASVVTELRDLNCLLISLLFFKVAYGEVRGCWKPEPPCVHKFPVVSMVCPVVLWDISKVFIKQFYWLTYVV